MMNIASLPQTVVDALALETATTAVRLRMLLDHHGTSRASQMLSLVAAFAVVAEDAGLDVHTAFATALSFAEGDYGNDEMEDLAVQHIRAGTNPPNAADVMAEETL